VGIRWASIQSSPFAGAIAEELSSDGSLGIPDLECLKDAQQILISSPDLLVMEAGTFLAATVHDQAVSRGWKHSGYRGVELWVTPGKDTLSIARISDQLVLLGHVKTLQEAIDRSLEENGRSYSPLLARAARYAQKDFWVVAAHLPDPLANIFVPIDAEADAFAGSVSIDDGLHLEASLTEASEKAAGEIAQALRHDVPAMPSFGRGLQIDTDTVSVRLAMELTKDQLAAGLRNEPQGSAVVATAEVRPVPALVLPTAVLPTAPKAPTIEPPRQVVRIWGLDEGPREIVLPRP